MPAEYVSLEMDRADKLNSFLIQLFNGKMVKGASAGIKVNVNSVKRLN